MPQQKNSQGVTLVELTLTLVIVGVLAAIAAPRAAAAIDRISVHGASFDVATALGVARSSAARRGDYASFVADPRTGRVRVVSGGEVLLERDLAHTRGVRMDVTRESVTFAPTGLGWGAANTTVVLSRGGQTDSVVTSRLGRISRR